MEANHADLVNAYRIANRRVDPKLVVESVSIRPLREIGVVSLQKSFVDVGCHAHYPISVIELSANSYRVIDGTHRVEALKRIIADLNETPPRYFPHANVYRSDMPVALQCIYALSTNESREHYYVRQTLLDRLCFIKRFSEKCPDIIQASHQMKISMGKLQDELDRCKIRMNNMKRIAQLYNWLLNYGIDALAQYPNSETPLIIYDKFRSKFRKPSRLAMISLVHRIELYETETPVKHTICIAKQAAAEVTRFI